jgi:hypothetical protein
MKIKEEEFANIQDIIKQMDHEVKKEFPSGRDVVGGDSSEKSKSGSTGFTTKMSPRKMKKVTDVPAGVRRRRRLPSEEDALKALGQKPKEKATPDDAAAKAEPAAKAKAEPAAKAKAEPAAKAKAEPAAKAKAEPAAKRRGVGSGKGGKLTYDDINPFKGLKLRGKPRLLGKDGKRKIKAGFEMGDQWKFRDGTIIPVHKYVRGKGMVGDEEGIAYYNRRTRGKYAPDAMKESFNIAKEELIEIIKEQVEKALGEQEQNTSSEDKTVFVIAAVKYISEWKVKQLPKPKKGDKKALMSYRGAAHDIQIADMDITCEMIKQYKEGDMSSIDRLYDNFLEKDKSDLGGRIENIAKTFTLKDIQCYGYGF